jgi:hypothetical protein
MMVNGDANVHRPDGVVRSQAGAESAGKCGLFELDAVDASVPRATLAG